MTSFRAAQVSQLFVGRRLYFRRRAGPIMYEGSWLAWHELACRAAGACFGHQTEKHCGIRHRGYWSFSRLPRQHRRDGSPNERGVGSAALVWCGWKICTCHLLYRHNVTVASFVSKYSENPPRGFTTVASTTFCPHPASRFKCVPF